MVISPPFKLASSKNNFISKIYCLDIFCCATKFLKIIWEKQLRFTLFIFFPKLFLRSKLRSFEAPDHSLPKGGLI